MRRLAFSLALLAASACAVVGLSAPANASPSAVLYQQFNFPDACSSAGYAGEQAGKWVEYWCTMVFPAGPGDTYPGLYDLYVVY